MAQTSAVSRIGIHATAETALPTLPSSAGSNVTVAAWGSAGFQTIGSSNIYSDTYDTGEDTFSLAFEDSFYEIMAPISNGVDDVIWLGTRLADIEIPIFDISEGLFTLASNITVASNIAKLKDGATVSLTPRAVGVEINKIGMFYFPKCIFSISNYEMGQVDGGAATGTITLKPLNTSSYPGGFSFELY